MKISRQLMFMVLAACTFQPGAAQEQTPPVFVGPGPSGEELAAMPQTPGAKGDQERHYYFEEAGREMGYHLYVPESYDPAVGAPLVVALHGFGVNYKFFFSVVPQLTSLCEQYGFICVAPMGYTISGWYGVPMTIPGAPPPGSNLPVPQTGNPAEQLRERELSELDVLNVIEILKSEYNIDTERTYLMGHSMGGFGTWHMGQKYVDRWAAIAPMSGINDNGLMEVDASKLAGTPVMVAVGEQEKPTVSVSKKAVAALRAAGGEDYYVEIAGGTHGSMVAPSTAQILEFFSSH
jgi:predicted peptidase